MNCSLNTCQHHYHSKLTLLNFGHKTPTVSHLLSSRLFHFGVNRDVHRREQSGIEPLTSWLKDEVTNHHTKHTWLSSRLSLNKILNPPHALLSDDVALIQDVGVTALVLTGGYALVSAFDYLSHNGLIPQNLSRKLVHILSGLFFMVSWPLFSTSMSARYFASVVPLANGLRLVVYGLSLVTDKALVKSVTREGNPAELLRGPLYYVLILALCAVMFWRESPVGLISLAMMSGGDGVADIMGRKFGTVKIPYNKNKSWAGSVSMFICGFLTSIVMLYYFSSLGYFKLNWMSTIGRVAVISFLASVVESLPSGLIDDNLSVPLATMIIAYICFSL